MNITNINDEVFRFQIYNLNYFHEIDKEIFDGHYTFWYNKVNKKWVCCKHAGYRNLISITPLDNPPEFPTPDQLKYGQEFLDKKLNNAYYYDGDFSCNRGRYFLDENEMKFPNGDSRGVTSYKNKDNEYFTYIGKENCVFPVCYDHEDDYMRAKDEAAIKLLQNNT